jgi:ribonuclease HI
VTGPTAPTAERVYGHKDLGEFRARVADLRLSLAPPVNPGAYLAYTDGACFGNPSGPGGWAAAVFTSGETAASWHLFGHLSSTSNNRAEALGVLAALEWVPARSKLSLHSDSELTIRLLQGRYKIKANSDIWELIKNTKADKGLDVDSDWVRGHAGDPLNELADRLSKLGAVNGSIDDLSGIALPTPPSDPPELAGLVARTDWEREFLSSVALQLRRGRPLSPKQQAVVDRIRSRPTGGPPGAR